MVSFNDGTYCDNLPPSDIVVSYICGSIDISNIKGVRNVS